jgi:hypothetical protein
MHISTSNDLNYTFQNAQYSTFCRYFRAPAKSGGIPSCHYFEASRCVVGICVQKSRFSQSTSPRRILLSLHTYRSRYPQQMEILKPTPLKHYCLRSPERVKVPFTDPTYLSPSSHLHTCLDTYMPLP